MMRILEKKPELIVEYRDPLEGFKGWLVLDDLSHKLCAGGIRVQKGLTCDRVLALARNMTLKMRISGIRADGVKSGIDYDPQSAGKHEALFRFIRAIRPYILERYSLGPDMNVTMPELEEIAGRLDIPSVKVAIAKAQGFALPDFIERYGVLKHPYDHVTLGKIRSGYGLAAACLGALDYLNISPKDATVAIQGFGGLGSGAAYALYHAGVRVLGLADQEKSLISADGASLDIGALIRDSRGGIIANGFKRGVFGKRERLYDVACDVLIPAAIENAVDADYARSLSVKAVVPGANLAITNKAEKILSDRGIIAVPDFIAGCGGSLSMDGLFGPEVHPSVQEVLDHVEKRMREIVLKVLKRSQKDSNLPRQAALELCSEAPLYPDAKPYGPLHK
jgi:glutamate dehydrogenase (NAD(P)+)